MNKQQCEQYTEWMSLAQDGILSRTQMHVLHTHIAMCPPCMTTWESMTMISQMFLVESKPTWDEMARRFGLSRERCRQICAKGLRTLRLRLEPKLDKVGVEAFAASA